VPPDRRHNLAQAIFQINQLAEKATFDHPSRPSPNVGGRILFRRCRGPSSQADLHVQLRSHARRNQARSGGLPFVAVVQTADFGSH
jgi:hypothetical protein